MMGSPQAIIAAIRTTLAERVLPELQPNTWTAGDIRSSLTLLTYLEDMLDHGREAIGTANQAMGAFLETLLALREVSFLDDALRSRLTTGLAQADEPGTGDLTDLHEINVHLKKLLSEIVAQSAGRGAAHDDAAAIDALRACLRTVAAQEQRIAARAGGMPWF